MNTLRRLNRWWNRLWDSKRVERDMDEELRDHIARRAEDLERGGVPASEAMRRARAEFGSVEGTKEDCRETRSFYWFDQFRVDIVFTLRTLLKNPGFTSVALLSLALGIGANTAIFSVVHAVLLRPLPYASPDRLVAIWESNPAIGKTRDDVAPLNFIDWTERATSFAGLSAFRYDGFNLSGKEYPEQITAVQASGNLFDVLGVAPRMGRGLTVQDEKSREKVVVVSYALWQQHLGGDPAAIGRSIELTDELYTVVGVMAPEFRFPADDPDVHIWFPMTFNRGDLSSRLGHSLSVVGRLAPGASVETAGSELNGIASQIAAADKDSNPGVVMTPMHEALVGNLRLGLWVVLGTVLLVLLIASANIANLLLAKAAARKREIALRTALGAGTGRLVRQFLTESLLLVIGGAVLGLILAFFTLDRLDGAVPAELLRLSDVTLAPPVLLFTGGLALLIGITFGLVPTFQASRLALRQALAEDGRASGSAEGRRVRSALVVAEVAVSVVLLVGAGLMLRSLAALTRVEPGFRAEGVVTGQIFLPQTKYPVDRSQYRPSPVSSTALAPQASFFETVLERTRSIPGVERAGAASSLPMNRVGIDFDLPVIIEGRPRLPDGEAPQADFRIVSRDYFETMEIPVLRGRSFSDFDRPGSVQVALVNDAMARQFFPDTDPIGQRLRIYGTPREIVGVVGSVRHRGLDQEPRPEMIVSHLQFQLGGMTLVVKSNLDAASLGPSIRSVVKSIDPDQPVTDVYRMEDHLAGSIALRRFQAILIGTFAALALVLSMIGIYGVISYSVAARTDEIGVRLALGASRMNVLGMVLKQGMALTLSGIAIGVILALAGARAASALLYNVSASDLRTFVLIPVLLAAAAFLACYIPARRATRLDPTVALRQG